MEIIETPIFTKQVTKNLPDEEYMEITQALIRNPALGPKIKGSGGIRKLRWGYEGRGKRGGCRIIYYWFIENNEILMLLLYTKNETDELTEQQLKTLKKIVERELK